MGLVRCVQGVLTVWVRCLDLGRLSMYPCPLPRSTGRQLSRRLQQRR